MPYTINVNNSWPRPTAGQEITITWSHADQDTPDEILMGAVNGTYYITPSGGRVAFQGYPDFSASLTGSGREAISKAFAAWDNVSGINFVEVPDSINSDIRIGVYGTGNGLVNSGESAFGHLDLWKGSDYRKIAIEINPNALVSDDRLFNTTLHQIGHALGLDDTSGLFVSSTADVMNPSGMPLQLSPDDIKGIQSLYGGEPPPPALVTQVARLYEAGLNRSFDVQGLNAWIDQRENGVPLNMIAGQFLDSPEFTQRFGDDDALSNATFIKLMYSNVLGRDPEPSGLSDWLKAMDSGMTREQVLIGFADSTENQLQSAYLNRLSQTQPGWWDLV